jgi:hypothetical protein
LFKKIIIFFGFSELEKVELFLAVTEDMAERYRIKLGLHSRKS